MGINFNDFMDHLNKRENLALKEEFNRFSTSNKTKEELIKILNLDPINASKSKREIIQIAIFDVLNAQIYNTSYKRITVQGDWGNAQKRRYNDENFYHALKEIENLKGTTNAQYKNQDLIIKCYNIIVGLKKCFDTSKPQSTPLNIAEKREQEIIPIRWDKNGQGYRDFFPEEENRKSIEKEQEKEQIQEKDKNNEKRGGSRIDDYYDN